MARGRKGLNITVSGPDQSVKTVDGKKVRGRGVTTLKKADVNEILREYPLTKSVEEMCIIRGAYIEGLSPEIMEYAEQKIRKNIVELKARLKAKLLKATKSNDEGNIKALTTLYQLIGDDDDLRRLGTPNMGKKQTGPAAGEIVIRSADSDIMDKLTDI